MPRAAGRIQILEHKHASTLQYTHRKGRNKESQAVQTGIEYTPMTRGGQTPERGVPGGAERNAALHGAISAAGGARGVVAIARGLALVELLAAVVVVAAANAPLTGRRGTGTVLGRGS